MSSTRFAGRVPFDSLGTMHSNAQCVETMMTQMWKICVVMMREGSSVTQSNEREESATHVDKRRNVTTKSSIESLPLILSDELVRHFSTEMRTKSHQADRADRKKRMQGKKNRNVAFPVSFRSLVRLAKGEPWRFGGWRDQQCK